MNRERENSEHMCLSCGSGEWYENKSFRSLPRVTSDSVPFKANGRICICLQCGLLQKITDTQWKTEIDSIYSNYKMYELTSGADQALFGEDGVTRAEKLVCIISKMLPEGFAGRVLDIGCGTGGFLKFFGAQFPRAKLYGQEIDDRNLRYLKHIPNFKTLFTARKPHGPEKFDIVTSIHCFEHIYDYAEYFQEIKAVSNGQILIQVPDIETSPFDIVIADHATHFSKDVLQHCLNRHADNFTVSSLVYKELTAIAPHPEANRELPPTAPRRDLIKTLDNKVNYLMRVLELINDERLSEFGVYGTTIAGAWLTAARKEKIAFYVDDDPLKQGKTFNDKKILAAGRVPNNCKVIMPFGPNTVRKILNTHANLRPLALFCEM